MSLTVFKETWLHLLRSTKNKLTFALVIIGLLAYSLLLLPRLDGFNTINLDQLERNTRSNQGIMQSAIEDERFDVNMFTGKSAYVDAKKKYENNRALLAAIENGDASRYRKLTNVFLPDFHYDDLYETYETSSLYPMKDYWYDRSNYNMRVNSYDESDLSFTVIQEKTAWQQIQLLLHDWGPTFFIVLTLFIASDVFVFNIHKRTQRIGVPVNWGSYLFIQSLAIFSFVLVLFLLVGVLFFVVNGLLFGFGSLDFQVPLYHHAEMPDMETVMHDLMSIGDFLIQTIPFFLLLIYLFIRLSALFSLAFRQSVVVFVVGLFTFLFERLYFSRTTRDLFGIDISRFPQTYFDFGKVISGEKNFLLNTGTVTPEQGLIVILSTVVVVEIVLAMAAYARTRQRFIQ